jgi:hypothetical protein
MHAGQLDWQCRIPLRERRLREMDERRARGRTDTNPAGPRARAPRIAHERTLMIWIRTWMSMVR